MRAFARSTLAAERACREPECTSIGSRTFRRVSRQESRVGCWYTMPFLRDGERNLRPSMDIVPVVGRSKPAIRRSSVVLPQPLGPTTETNSPGPMLRSTLCKALTMFPFSPMYTRPTLTTSTALGDDALSRAGSHCCPETVATDPRCRGSVRSAGWRASARVPLRVPDELPLRNRIFISAPLR